jgi:hypothetical protein
VGLARGSNELITHPSTHPNFGPLQKGCILQVIERIGRGEWIRTTGLLVPNQALYQAEPRPVFFNNLAVETSH